MMRRDDTPKKLSTRQMRGVTAVLKHGGLTEAAHEAGIPLATLKRWNLQPAFRQAVQDAQDDARRDAARYLSYHCLKAASCLVAALTADDSTWQSKIRAAQCILEQAQKWLELEEIEKRLSELEGKVLNDKL